MHLYSCIIVDLIENQSKQCLSPLIDKFQRGEIPMMPQFLIYMFTCKRGNDKKLRKGEELGPELKRETEGSHISIVVLSVNYANSSWCLGELVHIMVRHKSYGQFVLPVFYGVEPSVVRKQSGFLGEALKASARSVEFFNPKQKKENLLCKWKTALTEVANLIGWDSHSIR